MSYKKSLLFNSCSDKSKNIFDSYEWSLIVSILFLNILDRIAVSAIARAALRCLVFFGLIDTISSWYIGQKSHFSNICNFPGSETSRSINEPKSKKMLEIKLQIYVLLTSYLHEKRIPISTIKTKVNKQTKETSCD